LDLSDSRVTDSGLDGLRVIPTLQYLALNHTAVTPRGLQVLDSLPNLLRLEIAGTAIGRYAAWRTGRKHPTLEIVR